MKRMAILATLSAAACTSNYEAVRLSSNGDYSGVPADRAVGVPFTLTKPEFTIKRVEGSDPERFDIAVAYVPDSEQRYALRINPTWLAKIDFNVALGPDGGLTSSSADITDQAVPVATAVVKLAASIATAAPMLAMSARPPGPQSCLDKKGLGAIARCAVDASYAANKCSAEADDAITMRIDHALLTDKDDKGAVLTTLFARDPEEERCFKDAATQLQDASDKNGKAVVADFTAQSVPLTALVNGLSPPAAQLIGKAVALVTEVSVSGDVAKARRLVYATDLAVKNQPKYLRALLDLGADPPAADAQVLQGLLTSAQLAAGTGAEPIQALANGIKVQKSLAGLATMSAGQWRARYVPVLQYELGVAERGALSATKPADVAAFAATAEATREKLAAMVNMSAEYARLVQIDAILDTVPDFDASERQSRIEQYQGYAKQAADIRTEIATRLAAALATEQAKKKDAVLPSALPWVSRACIRKSSETGWIYTAGAEAPDYVIVLRNAAGDLVPPPRQRQDAAELQLPECGA